MIYLLFQKNYILRFAHPFEIRAHYMISEVNISSLQYTLGEK